jgi:hypothetical protein
MSGQVRSVRCDQFSSGQVSSGKVRLNKVSLGQVKSGQVRSGQARSELGTNVTLGDFCDYQIFAIRNFVT